jgi:hypothetical protein
MLKLAVTMILGGQKATVEVTANRAAAKATAQNLWTRSIGFTGF